MYEHNCGLLLFLAISHLHPVSAAKDQEKAVKLQKYTKNLRRSWRGEPEVACFSGGPKLSFSHPCKEANTHIHTNNKISFNKKEFKDVRAIF